jgi:hypothetical protein
MMIVKPEIYELSVKPPLLMTALRRSAKNSPLRGIIIRV